MSYICVCSHCGEQWKAPQTCKTYCATCSTADGRNKIDLANKKIKEKKNTKNQ